MTDQDWTLAVEVFREDVDELTKMLLIAVGENTEHMPFIDRAIVVATALANVANTVDGVEAGPYNPECTMRLKNIASHWKSAGG